jgi:3-oxoacyl-[acyl-carrier protein] reductase|tara:strand:- start:40 stop:744 length:705 start_codon:yes stop_codon:yes gene_type:complete
MNPKQKTILITGNRKGIGRYLSEYYLEKGYNVVGCSRSSSDLSHKNYIHFLCDVKKEKEVKTTIRSIKKLNGGVNILINNAGKASLNHSILTPSETVKDLFETNYLGSFLFSRECSKQMIKSKWGRIINFSTIAVPLDLEGEMAYSCSKSAIEKMSRIMSKELSSYNITINTIGPTPVYTDLIKVVPKDKVEEIINMQSIKRFGTFEDISNVTDFFISNESSFITGQKIYLGGL